MVYSRRWRWSPNCMGFSLLTPTNEYTENVEIKVMIKPVSVRLSEHVDVRI